MQRRVLIALAALVGALFAAPGGAHPVLSFEEQNVIAAAPNAKVKASEHRSPVSVTLGHRYLSMDSATGRDILDFKIRRLYHVDLRKKTYEESSLFAMAGFALLESQNRLAANPAQDPAVPDDVRAPPMVAQLFSVAVKGGDAQIDSTTSAGSTVYQWKGYELLSISDASSPLAPQYQAEYWRWLRLYYGGHPRIYAQLKGRSGVPESLRILRPDAAADTTVTLHLKSVADTGANSYSLDGFRPITPKAQPYLTLLRLETGASALLEVQEAETLKYRDAAAAAGQTFDAQLAFLVHSVASGDLDSEWTHKMASALNADPEAARLAGALSAKSDEQMQLAVTTLASLRKNSRSSYAYVLDVFAANHQVKLRNTDEAERLFLKALAQNPLLTGAWFDLGKVYYATLRTREAWACWDAARSLNPMHPFRKDIDGVERRMVAELPQFF